MPFSKSYCSIHKLPETRFIDHFVGRSLHAPIRWIWPVAKWLTPSFFSADRELALNIGRLTRLNDIPLEITEFQFHPANRHFLRRKLRQRVSIRRLQRQIRTVG